MSCTVVLGAQWGDEGKGKIVDILTEKADVVARYSGGHNAGHTVVIGGIKYILHLVPSGIMHGEKINIIGNGVVIDPKALLSEMDDLKKQGVVFGKGFYISKRAHVILPYHGIIDRIREEIKGSAKIGTTGRGIGPTYADKAARNGIRICDLYDKEVFYEKLEQNVKEANFLLEQKYGSEKLDTDAIFNEYLDYAEQIRPFVAETTYLINELHSQGKRIMMEGAQGCLLDVDFGTYPFVTSSNATAGGACTGTGLSPVKINRVVGVLKAYTTRVGGGPFPTELLDADGERLREVGKEYGATTGRPRRCGWQDLVAAKYGVITSGTTDIALTKLDVLTGMDKLKVCVAYKINGVVTEVFPPEIKSLETCEPVYEVFDGWKEDITNVQSYDELPLNARKYLDFIKNYLNVEYCLVSVGVDRKETILLKEVF
jgi:adenylosuccinate synthase